jgi:hypothetical protein
MRTPLGYIISAWDVAPVWIATKPTGRLLIGLAVLEDPILKGRKFDVMQTTEVFLDHRRGVPLLDQIKIVLLLSGIHCFLPKN